MNKNVSDILNSIDSIDMCCLEASTDVSNAITEYEQKEINMDSILYPVNDNDFYTEYVMIQKEYAELSESFVQEGVIGAIGDFFRKIIELIKKFFGLIGKGIKFVFETLFRIKPKGTPDEAIQSIALSTHDSQNAKEPASSNKKVKIKFPAGKGSTYKECDLTLLVKDVHVKIENDKYVIGTPEGFELEGMAGKLAGNKQGIKVPVTANNCCQANAFFAFVENKNDFRRYIEKAINWLSSRSDAKGDVSLTKDEIDEFYDAQFELNKQLRHHMINTRSITASSSDLLNYQKTINDMIKKIDKINTIPENPNKTYKAALDSLVSLLEILSIGCNQVANDIVGMYMIDAKYLHTISDVETLGKFVNKMIDDGIPGKYVAYNTWCAMSEDFDNRKFFYKKSGIFDMEGTYPRWGQSRVVFFPGNTPKEVLKVALNRAGILANKRELQIYDMYKKHNSEDILAKPNKSYAKNTIITMEKLDTKDITQTIVMDMRGKIAKLNIVKSSLHTINDIHAGNIGKADDGAYKIIDYAG